MRGASIDTRAAALGPLRSRRLLALAGDERLVEQIRRGNEAAFEVVFERHGPAILGFCRHMLGSREEAEDAVQHTFAAAHRDLQDDGQRRIALKPWLFAIARNRCVSVLRARREQPGGDHADLAAMPTAGLAEQVEQRAELRQLLADLRELPEQQRAALLLAEVGDLSHAEVAGVLGCEVQRVKALVFRARSALIARREAREAPCERIREQLANLRGGSLRRTELRLHLRDCPGCQAYREQVAQQRRMLAAALPVAPTLGLKSSVLAAVGLGGGSAGGGAVAAGIGGALSATFAKVAVVGVLAGGGAVVGTTVVGPELGDGSGVDSSQAVSPTGGGGDGVGAPAAAGDGARGRPGGRGRSAPGRSGTRGRDGRSGRDGLRGPSSKRDGRAGAKAVPPGRGGPERGRRRGHERKELGGTQDRGRDRGRARGPVEAPPPVTPVKRGPPEDRPQEALRAPKPSPQPKAKTEAPTAEAPPAPASGLPLSVEEGKQKAKG